MAPCDRATADVYTFLIQADLLDTRQRLSGERLVDLGQIDAVRRQLRTCEGLLRRRNRAEPHVAGLHTRRRGGDIAGARLHAEALERLLARQQQRARAVVEPRGVAGGDRAHALGRERRAQLRELLERGVGARVLVERELQLGAGLLVDAGDDRRELLGRATARDRLRGALLRGVREAILILARDAAALGDALGGLAHRDRAVQRLHLGIHEPPAERGVVDGVVAARERLGGLAHDERRARHLLDAAGDHDVGLAGL